MPTRSPYSLARTGRLADFHSERQLQQFHDAEDADAAVEERGAAAAHEELARMARLCTPKGFRGADAQRCFVACFVSVLRTSGFHELATAIAETAGMPEQLERADAS